MALIEEMLFNASIGRNFRILTLEHFITELTE